MEVGVDSRRREYAAVGSVIFLWEAVMTTGATETEAAVKAAVAEFAVGLDGNRTEPGMVEMAARIVSGASANTVKHDISFDDEECALSFDLELSNGHLILAELWSDGSIDASVYDSEKRRIKRMPKATELDVTDWFRL